MNEPSAFEQFLGNVTTLVSTAFGTWIPAVINAITANPILLIGFIMSVAGFGIGCVKRLTRLG